MGPGGVDGGTFVEEVEACFGGVEDNDGAAEGAEVCHWAWGIVKRKVEASSACCLCSRSQAKGTRQ